MKQTRGLDVVTVTAFAAVMPAENKRGQVGGKKHILYIVLGNKTTCSLQKRRIMQDQIGKEDLVGAVVHILLKRVVTSCFSLLYVL